MGDIMINITKVSINPSGDGYDAIFIDGKLLMNGDYYHDKIYEKIEGIVEYLNFKKEKYKIKGYEFDVKSKNDCWSDFDYFAEDDEAEYLIKLRSIYKEL